MPTDTVFKALTRTVNHCKVIVKVWLEPTERIPQRRTLQIVAEPFATKGARQYPDRKKNCCKNMEYETAAQIYKAAADRISNKRPEYCYNAVGGPRYTDQFILPRTGR